MCASVCRYVSVGVGVCVCRVRKCGGSRGVYVCRVRKCGGVCVRVSCTQVREWVCACVCRAQVWGVGVCVRVFVYKCG